MSKEEELARLSSLSRLAEEVRGKAGVEQILARAIFSNMCDIFSKHWKWLKYGIARDKFDNELSYPGPEAIKWSLAGLLMLVAEDDEGMEVNMFPVVVNILYEVIKQTHPFRFNHFVIPMTGDMFPLEHKSRTIVSFSHDERTTLEDIRKVLNKAIKQLS